jgi:hypothetical protein
MSTPHELFRAWRQTTDAYAQWQRQRRQLQAIAQRCRWQQAELHLEGGHWRLEIGNGNQGDEKIISVTMLAADDCTP